MTLKLYVNIDLNCTSRGNYFSNAIGNNFNSVSNFQTKILC